MRLTFIPPILLTLLLACSGGSGTNNTPPVAKAWSYTDPPATPTNWRVIKVSSTSDALTLGIESPGDSRELVGLGVSVSGATVALSSLSWPTGSLLAPVNPVLAGVVTLNGESVVVTKQVVATFVVTRNGETVPPVKLENLSVVYKNNGQVIKEAANMGTVAYQ